MLTRRVGVLHIERIEDAVQMALMTALVHWTTHAPPNEPNAWLCRVADNAFLLLAEHSASASPETFTLLALMHLHLARLYSRIDSAGGVLLLEEQDRAQWDRAEIECGLRWLERSAHRDVFSRYHAEAGIAAEHCLAPSIQQTRWGEIANLYAMLERIAPSPLHAFKQRSRSRAVARTAGWHCFKFSVRILEVHRWQQFHFRGGQCVARDEPGHSPIARRIVQRRARTPGQCRARWQ